MDCLERGDDGAGGGGDDAVSCNGGGEVVGDTTQFRQTGLEEEKEVGSIFETINIHIQLTKYEYKVGIACLFYTIAGFDRNKYCIVAVLN